MHFQWELLCGSGMMIQGFESGECWKSICIWRGVIINHKETQRISGGQDNVQDREGYQNMLQSVWP